MSPDNPTQILTTHDLSNLRSLQSVSTSVAASTPTTFVSNNHTHNNMVLSTIPLDGHALLIQRSQLSTASIASNTQQQLRTATVSATNGLRTTNANNASNNLSNLLAAAAKSQTILSTSNGSSTSSSSGNMPTTSNYVFLQQNGNGQYTTYEGTTNNNSTNVGKIVLLATEPMDLNGSNNTEQQHVITTTGDNDEELRPLSWLNDSNLIKGIVTTSAAANAAGNNGAKRALGNNICIVSTNNAHDLIEELPPHVAGEEHVATTNSNNGAGNTDLGDTQIMSVSDYQQQFIASNKRFGNNQQFNTLANFALSDQDAAAIVATSTAGTKEQQQHVYSNIAAIGATTTVHVGPSGTTTVVEYKSNANYMPTQRQMLGNNVASNATTITATNLTNSNNNYVPSTTTASNNNNIHVPASTTPAKQISLPNTIVTTTSGNNNVVANGNSATNTIYQGQKQTNGNSNNSSAGSTTHHPHKKYLREKMNVMDHGGGGIATSSAAVAVSTITVVSSPASSNNSLSSSSSTSSSTAAVNGGNSPVSKSFYTLGGGSGGTAVAVNYSNSSNSSSSAAATFVAVSAPSSSLATSPSLTTVMPTYTIVSQHQQQQQHVVSSPAMSSPEPPNSKEYYTLTAPQHHQQQQQQQLQLQQQHLSMRSPTSYSSYENDSLKDFEMSTTNSSASGVRLTTSTPQHHSQQQQTTPKSSSSSSAHANSATPQKQKHPNNVPYDPLVHTHNKPPYSFSSLIFMAIEGSNEKALPVKEIYAWIVQHFPYFKTAPTGWKNSVRHNLSLNKSFVKVEKAPNMGKGSLWRVEQQQRQNLIQALTRSPFFPNSAVDKIALKSPNGGIANTTAYDTVDGNSSSGGKGSSAHIDPRFDPRLFPNLSKAFKVLTDVAVADVPDDEIPSDYSTTNHNNNSNKKYNYSSSLQNGGGGNSGSTIMGAFSNYESMERLARDCGADSIDDVNAAAAMLALKHGPKVFAETFQNGSPVITSSPSEDHTYSAGGGSTTGSGASTPHTNGNSGPQQQQAAIIVNGNGVAANGQLNGCDNQSNCASSDAAYESSEENHNITPEELEDQQRHRDGVDALLSLSLSSVIDSSTSCSPIKRPSSTSVEEEHISACISPTASHQHHHMGNKMALLTNAAAAYSHHPQAHHHSILDEGYNTQSYYVSNVSHHHLHHLASPSPQKKTKPLRNLRTKIKRKAPWLR